MGVGADTQGIGEPDWVAEGSHVLAGRGKLEAALAAAERAVSLGGPLLEAARATLEDIRRQAAAQKH